MESDAEKSEAKIEIAIMTVERKLMDVDAMLKNVDTSAVIMGRVMDLNSVTVEAFNEKFADQGKDVAKKIKKIYDNELSMEGHWGPGHEKYKSLREYMINKVVGDETEMKNGFLRLNKAHYELVSNVQDLDLLVSKDMEKKIMDLRKTTDE